MPDRFTRALPLTCAAALCLALAACGGGHSAGTDGASGSVKVSAGAARTVVGSRPVRLVAASDAPDAIYRWSLASKPKASRLSPTDIAGRDSQTATLTPDVAGIYIVRLVMHSKGREASATVKVTSRLAVDAGPDRTVQGTHPVKLDATSNAPAPEYHWTFLSRPRGSRAGLKNADSAHAVFTPDVDGIYRIELDLKGHGLKDTVTITARHIWRAGIDHRPPNEVADGTALAVTRSGTLYAAYRDGDRAMVKRFDGRHWAPAGHAPASAADAHYIALAAGPHGTLYIAYQDFSRSGRGGITVRKLDGGRWRTLGHAGFSAGEAEYVALAVAPDGTPYVAYEEFSPAAPGRLRVERFRGGRWTRVGRHASLSPGEARYISLAIATDGTPYVAYQDMHDVHMGIAVQRFNGTQWELLGNAGFSAGTALYVSLAVAPGGTPYVAYEDGGHDHPDSVKRYDSPYWAFVGDDWFTRGEAEFGTLAFGPHGAPYLAYQDEVHDGASVMRFDGKHWRRVGQPGMSKGEAGGLSFVISRRGHAYVAYHDDGDGDRVVVKTLRHGRWVTLGGGPLSKGETDDADAD